jgi:hypothetical protein
MRRISFKVRKPQVELPVTSKSPSKTKRRLHLEDQRHSSYYYVISILGILIL